MADEHSQSSVNSVLNSVNCMKILSLFYSRLKNWKQETSIKQYSLVMKVLLKSQDYLILCPQRMIITLLYVPANEASFLDGKLLYTPLWCPS